MELNKNYCQDWMKRFKRIQNHRKKMWNDLNSPEVKSEWIITRVTPHQWSIDELIRHMLASEIRYIHQSFDPDAQQLKEAVAAQWVNERFFRLKEDDHVDLECLREIATSLEKKSVKLLDSPDKAYEKTARAPWGEEMNVCDLLEAYYTHEFYHQGQVYSLLTYFRGLPKVIESQRISEL